MPADARHIAAARTLAHSVASGVLSTHSVAMPGYPFGSVAPFALQADGSIALLISAIAQHTANIQANPKVSLLVRQEASEDGGTVADSQAVGRATFIGDARRVPPDKLEATAEHYFLFFPDSRSHFGVHDFAFYAIEPVRIRYIGGFGSIHWIEPDAWRPPVTDWKMGARAVIDHMNDDHGDALAAMCAALRSDEAKDAEMLTVDADGFHVRTSRTVHYFAFAARCTTSDEVRAEMVRLSRTARALLPGQPGQPGQPPPASTKPG